jgi:putative transposase
MPRSPRIEFPGAVYHVLARGDRREPIVWSDEDRWMFLHTLGAMCGRTGARVHAWALMDNHYHLLLETPKANLVAGMSWFQNTYTRRFNSRNRQWGHVFGGRYKAVVVQHRDGPYFLRVLDYIHLNPVRAGVSSKGEGFDSHPWTSLREYRKPPGRRQEWMETGAGFEATGLRDSPAGRRKFVERLETLIDWSCPDRAGRVLWEGQGLQSTLRRGWYFGSQEFREELMRRLGKVAGMGSRPGLGRADHRDHALADAEAILEAGLRHFGLAREELPRLRKGDPRKALLAFLIKDRTSVAQSWIVERLSMGTKPYVSRLAGEVRKRIETGDRRTRKQIEAIARIIT